MLRSIMRIGATTLVLFVAGFPGHGVARGQDPFDWDEVVPRGAVLQVFTASGDVEVVASPDEVARVRGRTVTPPRVPTSDVEIRYEVVREGRNVRICALHPGDSCSADRIQSPMGDRAAQGGADLRVEVPVGVELRVATTNGTVNVQGATAGVYARSGNGRVSVGPGAEEVRASSGNGGVEVRGARGPVRASTGNGAVFVSTARGPVDATTGNGSIEARMAWLPRAGEMSFRTGNGGIRLVLPDDFSGEVRGWTANGALASAFSSEPPRRVRFGTFATVIGSGDWRIDATTGNGSVELRRHSNPGAPGIER